MVLVSQGNWLRRTGADRSLFPDHLEGMSTPVSQDRWLKTREVADRLGIHLNTMARYIKAGAFGDVLVLSQTDRRIRESALEHFITQRLAR